MKLRIATRRSRLSIRQVELVINALKEHYPDVEPEFVFVKTKGDIHIDKPPAKIGSKGIFEKEVNLAVLRGEADIAVHSMKDVPIEISERLTLAAVLPRGSPLDVLVSRGKVRLEELPEGSIVGTSSVRRRAALRCLRPDLIIEHLRGNVDTRIRKLKEGLYDAIVIAEAGLRRLGLEEMIAQVFKPREITPAPCQGVIAVYARDDEEEVLRMMRRIDDPETRLEISLEREIVKRVGGGCFTPLGVLAEVAGDQLTITASLYSPTGREKLTLVRRGDVRKHREIVDEMCENLLREGRGILAEARVSPRGKVAIVGAGPGDPKLITVKGLEMLRRGDVVIYDRLVSKRLLKEAKPGAELIFAGKATGVKALRQEEINELMIQKAREGNLVVRLKGGDPFVLGRGGEEMIALARAGIDFEVVPGVSSAIAAPAVAYIPVTHRGLSSSFAVSTGREDPHKLRRHIDFRRIAKAADTIIVLMGLSRLREICRELVEGGLPTTTPAVIIKEATTEREVTVEGTVGDIAERVERRGISPPVVLVVGRVIDVRREIEALRREEKIILSFRPEETAGELETLLTEAGHTCINIPAARVLPLATSAEAEDALEDADYIVFTSQISVRMLEEILGGERLVKALSGARVLAIGPKTREAVERLGVSVYAVPDRYSSHELSKMLLSHPLRGVRVTLFRSADADETLEKELRKVGAFVRRVTTHKLTPSGQLSSAAHLIKEGGVKALVLTSPRIARFVDEGLREVGTSLSGIFEKVTIFSIGPATSKMLAELGVKRFVEAERYTARGLYEAIVETMGEEMDG